MPDTNATILIPDISGFTEFMTTTELDHGSHAINLLLDAIIQATGNEYEVSEIEGDAVLMFKRGPAPSKKEILDICLKIFNAFHYQRKWMQQHTICPCGACQGLIKLTLKFVVHHGAVGEMKVGRFVTLSGTDVIIAHRLLKNSVPSNEYLLMTDNLWKNLPDASDHFEMVWDNLSDEFASIGKVDYYFARLEPVRKKIPDPPPVNVSYISEDTSSLDIIIDANYRDAYMILMDIPNRAGWVPGLLKVEQEIPKAFIGSAHQCSFENYSAVISPLKMLVSDEGILYAESCTLVEKDITMVCEFLFKRINDNNCTLNCRILKQGEIPVPGEILTMLFDGLKQMTIKLKEISEGMAKVS
jgi:hypothetical protein